MGNYAISGFLVDPALCLLTFSSGSYSSLSCGKEIVNSIILKQKVNHINNNLITKVQKNLNYYMESLKECLSGHCIFQILLINGLDTVVLNKEPKLHKQSLSAL